MTTIEKHEVIHQIPPLTDKDTCELCVQRAHWSVMLREYDEPLTFCFHHSYLVEFKIKELNPFAIRDDRLQFIMNEDALRS